MEINKTFLGISAGVVGTLFLGYCLYFDAQRRKDPEYKKKIHERRKRTKKSKAERLPNLVEKDAVQKFFLQEVQLGENCIANGNIEQSVEHFANAVIVCGQPSQLLQVLQQTLPSNVFMLLIEKMKQYTQQLPSQTNQNDELE